MNENEEILENSQNDETETQNSTNQTESDSDTSLSDSVVKSEENTDSKSSSTVFTEVKSEPDNIQTEDAIATTSFQDINSSYTNVNTENSPILDKKESKVSKIFKNKWFYIFLALAISLTILLIVLLKISKDNKENIPSSSENISESSESENNTQEQESVIDSNLRKRKIDGVLVDESESNIWPYAIVIENSTDARPLSGVNEANICYEVLVEGSITRFICIYADGKNVTKIGPVRSARPYFGDIADEYNGLFVHFGGSSEALERIQKGYYNIVNMDGIPYDGIYFWRDRSRNAPHNAYISTDLIKQFLTRIKEADNIGNYPEWSYTDKNISEIYSNTTTANTIDIKYSDTTSVYNVIWKYDSEKDLYTRYYEGGKIDKDANGVEITAKNIIIQFTTTNVIDAQLRKSINLTEGGKAIIIENGHSIEGYWKKNNLTNRTKFYTTINGVEKEIEFNPGKTWVNIVPKDYKVNID